MRKFLTLLTLCALFGVVGVSAQVRPDSPTDFKGEVLKDGDGNYYVQLTVTAPTNERWGGPELTGTLSLNFYRMDYETGSYRDELFKTVDGVKPGETITIEDKTVSKGFEYMYRVAADCGEGEGYAEYIYGLYVGVKPGVPTLTAEVAEDGMPPVKLTIVTPTMNENGSEIEGKMTVTLKRGAQYQYNDIPVIATFEGVAPGETLTYEDTPEELSKNYTYFATVSTDDGISDEAQRYIFVGHDLPGAPQNVEAKANADGSVTITWMEPTSGPNGGKFTTPVYYDVTRKDGTMIVEKTTELSAVDPCTDLTAQVEMQYIVYAYNDEGSNPSSNRYSGSVVAGPAAKLPFYESFNGEGYYGGPVNIWTTSGYSWYYYNQPDYEYGIAPVNYVAPGEDGTDGVEDGMVYLSFTYYAWGGYEPETYTLTSGSLNFDNTVNPVVSFYYVPMVCGNKFDVLCTVDDVEYVMATYDLNDGADDADEPVYEWKKVYVELGDMAGVKNLTLSFKGYDAETSVDDNASLYLDEVLIDDYPYVAEPVASVSQNTVTLTWADPSTDTQKVDHYAVIVNGEKMADVTETMYAFDGETGVTYEMAVVACYEEYDAPASAAVKATIEGTSSISVTMLGGDETSVEFYGLDGTRLEKPVAGTTIIRRATLKNGDVRTTKLIAR